VRFAPAAVGSYSATLTFGLSGGGGRSSVRLSGLSS
jgi:hypothetical protein